MIDDDHPLTGLFLKGRLRHAMTADEVDAIERMFHQTERFTESHTLWKRGEVVNRSTMLVEGFIVRAITERDRRHIVGIQVPGDFVDLHAYALKRLDHDLISIGPTRVAYVEHDELNKVLQDNLHLTRLMWFSTLLDAAIHREWIMKMEQLSADGRLAHLMAEVWERLRMVGLGDAHGFGFPLTQADLADACGTTPIHMNRIVGKLRSAKIVDVRRGRVSVEDEALLRTAARFDPAYLYGKGMLALRREFDVTS